MPSFTGAGAELRQLARVWRTGNLAFRELFDVLPKEEGQTYNKMVLNKGASERYLDALVQVDDAWIASRVNKVMRGPTQALRHERQRLVERNVPKAEITRQLRPLRKGLQERRKQLTQEIVLQGGIMAEITKAVKTSDAAKAKALLVLSLGQYLEEGA